MRVRSSVVTCLVLSALGLPALAVPGGKAKSPEARQAERTARQAKQAQRKAERAKRKAEKEKRKAAKSFTKKFQVTDEELATRVATVQQGLAWHDDLSEARAAATKAKKPILWIHALGDLSGLL